MLLQHHAFTRMPKHNEIHDANYSHFPPTERLILWSLMTSIIAFQYKKTNTYSLHQTVKSHKYHQKKRAYYRRRSFRDVKCKPLPPHQILCPLYLFQVISDTQFDPNAHSEIHIVICDGELFTYTAGVKAIGIRYWS